jgi:hypothetical protein
MSISDTYSPQAIERMAAVYKLAVKELKLERASIEEHERLAVCILSIGNTYDDPHRLLDKTIRLYVRSPRLNSRTLPMPGARRGIQGFEGWK